MTKGERNKDSEKGKKYHKKKETYDILIYDIGGEIWQRRERYNKWMGSTKILSTQVGGASS